MCAVGYSEATLEALLIIRDVSVVVVAKSADKFENLATDVNNLLNLTLRGFGACSEVAADILVKSQIRSL